MGTPFIYKATAQPKSRNTYTPTSAREGMPYYKRETEANGHNVVVQQVRGPESKSGASSPGAWINGKAVYLSVVRDHPECIPEDFVPDDFMNVQQVERLVAYLASNSLLLCKKCNDTFNIEDSVSTDFAGVKCKKCSERARTCDDGGKHDLKCLNPHQKHNARVATKYKCTKCGKKSQTTPTG